MSKKALIPFEEFIEKSNQAKDVDELLTIFLSATKSHGLDKMIFCLLSDHEEIGLKAGVGHLANYQQDWLDYYFSQGFDKIDPVISYCYQKQGSFTWSELAQGMNLSPIQKKCLYGGIEAGLNAGICAPVWGPHRFAGIGLASSEKKDNFDGKIDLITAYCNHFYIVFKKLHQKEKNDNKIVLSSREREVLLWMSKGKTYDEIGTILSVSEHTVIYHVRNIFRKLHANDRTLAVAKALSFGLIFR